MVDWFNFVRKWLLIAFSVDALIGFVFFWGWLSLDLFYRYKVIATIPSFSFMLTMTWFITLIPYNLFLFWLIKNFTKYRSGSK